MLMIRFQRIGRTNDAAFRIVVLEKASGPKAGTYTDLVGSYNPKTKALQVNGERVKEWMAKGAQVSPSLMNLLVKKGIVEGKVVPVISKTNLEKNIAKKAAEDAAAAAKAAEEAAKAEAAAAKAAEEAAAAEAVAPAEEALAEAPAEEVVAEEPVAEEALAEEEVAAEVAA